MDVLVTCKYEKDLIKNEGARVDTTLYSNFSESDTQGQITPNSHLTLQAHSYLSDNYL